MREIPVAERLGGAVGHHLAGRAALLARFVQLFVLIGLAVKLRDWGTPALIATIAGLTALDILLIVLSARTWRREEVLAQR